MRLSPSSTLTLAIAQVVNPNLFDRPNLITRSLPKPPKHTPQFHFIVTEVKEPPMTSALKPTLQPLRVPLIDSAIENGMSLHTWRCSPRHGTTVLLVTNEDRLLAITDYLDSLAEEVDPWPEHSKWLYPIASGPTVLEAILQLEDTLGTMNHPTQLTKFGGTWWKYVDNTESALVAMELAAAAGARQ